LSACLMACMPQVVSQSAAYPCVAANMLHVLQSVVCLGLRACVHLHRCQHDVVAQIKSVMCCELHDIVLMFIGPVRTDAICCCCAVEHRKMQLAEWCSTHTPLRLGVVAEQRFLYLLLEKLVFLHQAGIKSPWDPSSWQPTHLPEPTDESQHLILQIGRAYHILD